jgi:cold shock CspA family protein
MKKILGLIFVLAILIASCNLPGSMSTDPQIATAAALTVQAAMDAQTPLASPTAAAAPTEALSTPTYSQPMASVGDVTNCRSGPGTNYERVTQLRPGESVNIVGFFSPNYWVVSSKDGECWLSGEFATPVGSFAAVATVTAPPTPKGGAPDIPSFKKDNGWTFFCKGDGQTDITLSWADVDNEAGYRILRNGDKVAELPADSSYFAETITLLAGQSVGYQVQAYNSAGETNSSTAKMTCPP